MTALNVTVRVLLLIYHVDDNYITYDLAFVINVLHQTVNVSTSLPYEYTGSMAVKHRF